MTSGVAPAAVIQFGHELPLADADWSSASDGKEPVAAAEGMRTIDPEQPVVL